MGGPGGATCAPAPDVGTAREREPVPEFDAGALDEGELCLEGRPIRLIERALLFLGNLRVLFVEQHLVDAIARARAKMFAMSCTFRFEIVDENENAGTGWPPCARSPIRGSGRADQS